MKAVKAITSILFIALISVLLSSLCSEPGYAAPTALVLFVVIGLVTLQVKMPVGAFMAITREIWTKDIVDNLWKNNDWAARAFNADMYVLLGKVVHIPVAGAASSIKKNVTVFPVNAVKRTDTDITYSIDTFYSTPRHIEQIEKYELEYDKRQSALGEDQSALIEAAMDSLLYRWAPLVANCVLTAGDDAAATASGATGQRKKFTKAAFADVKRKMDKAKISGEGRIAVLTAEHYNDFLASLSDAEKVDVGRVADLATGKVGKYLNFEIYMRSTVLRYRGADGVMVVVDEQADDYAATDDDRSASLIYQVSCVERAKGSVEIFENPRQAEYYGDIYSMELRLGGRQRRAAGVYAIVEALAA
jgi:hypothetical protein